MTAERKFKKLAEAIATKNHPAINPVLEFGEEDNRPFLVMPVLTGGNLTDRQAGQTLSVSEAIDHFLPLAEALDFAAKGGVLHHDLKPNNIVFDDNGRPYLVDLGIMQIVDELSTAQQPKANPQYVAPEQVRDRDLDARTHVYSLGAILYEALTGKPVFSGASPMVTAFKHVCEHPKPPSLIVSDLGNDIDDVILKALEKKPEDRFSSTTRFLRALETASAGPLRPGLALNEPKRADLEPTLVEPAISDSYIQHQHSDHLFSSEPAPQAPSKSRNTRLTVSFLIGMLACVLLFGVSCAVYFLTVAELQPDLTATALAQVDVAAQQTVTAAEQRLQNVFSWPITLSESFDDNNAGWFVGQLDDEFAINDIEINNTLNWSAVAKRDFIWRIWPSSLAPSTNFYASVEAQMLSGGLETAYGIAFRNSQSRDAYYVFDIREIGDWSVSAWDSGSWNNLFFQQRTDAINVAGVNRLEVIAQGAEFHFYVNGQYLGQVDDSQISDGTVGLSVALNNIDESAVMEFDNFVLLEQLP